MEAALLKLFSVTSLLLCFATSAISQALKILLFKQVRAGWGHRMMTLAPLLIGVGLAVIPGVLEEACGVKVLWGISCGSVSTMVFKMTRRFLKGRFKNEEKDT